mmetsp:Transcript_37651/g.62425  ORF Transcript_37651/g.62425 Transcript_37651/m.62425 type:complete len:204 (-) Transcript_37651:823-1434(-)
MQLSSLNAFLKAREDSSANSLNWYRSASLANPTRVFTGKEGGRQPPYRYFTRATTTSRDLGTRTSPEDTSCMPLCKTVENHFHRTASTLLITNTACSIPSFGTSLKSVYGESINFRKFEPGEWRSELEWYGIERSQTASLSFLSSQPTITTIPLKGNTVYHEAFSREMQRGTEPMSKTVSHCFSVPRTFKMSLLGDQRIKEFC